MKQGHWNIRVFRAMEMLKDKTSSIAETPVQASPPCSTPSTRGLSLDTGDISQNLGRGRHTTRHVELFELPQGGFVADTPGFSAVDLEKLQGSSRMSWQIVPGDAQALRASARFAAVTPQEQGCAVLQAVKDGEISQSRCRRSYLNLYEQAKNIRMESNGPLRFAAAWERDRQMKRCVIFGGGQIGDPEQIKNLGAAQELLHLCGQRLPALCAAGIFSAAGAGQTLIPMQEW